MTYSLDSGTLPSGISLTEASGVLSGTSSAGSYSFTIKATFSLIGEATAAYTLVLT